MKLRSNEPCPIHRSLFCCGREQMRKQTRLQPGVRRVEDPYHPRGYRELRSPAEMRKLLNRKIVERTGNVPSATKGSRITTTSCLTTRIRKEWEEPGGTIIRIISKQHTGGATERKGQPGLTTDGRLAVHSSINS